MKKVFLVVITLLCCGYDGTAQSKKKGTDDQAPIWIEKDVVYGEATTQAGLELELKMDIYGPKGDSLQKKPVILLAHGGYFISGGKRDFADECAFFAEEGFVAVSIQYRLIDVENSDQVSMMAAIDAVNDMRAAVRYLYKTATEGNPFSLDTTNIFIGGYSAGAITALHYAYAHSLEDAEEMGGEWLVNYIQQSGGLEGSSGNPGYSSNVRGVINIAGSLHSAKFVEADEPVLYSAHGTNDQIVPYELGSTGETTVETEGSYLIHRQADLIGLPNYLHTFERGNHASFFFCQDCLKEVSQFVTEHLSQL